MDDNLFLQEISKIKPWNFSFNKENEKKLKAEVKKGEENEKLEKNRIIENFIIRRILKKIKN